MIHNTYTQTNKKENTHKQQIIKYNNATAHNNNKKQINKNAHAHDTIKKHIHIQSHTILKKQKHAYKQIKQ